MCIDKYYIGMTQESIESRLKKHNSGEYTSSFTSQARDWELFFLIECETTQQAIRIEKHIKSMKSRKYIEDLKKFPEISVKLKNRFSK